jgi:two-component system, chemotaxis family, response regulator PixG
MISENNTATPELSFKNLIIQLKSIKEQSFSGNLTVRVDGSQNWIFSFRMGRLGWVGGGIEPVDRWQRNLALAQLELPPDKLARIDTPESSDSHLLAQLLIDESIDRQKSADIVGRMTIECLFDIIQFSQHSGNRLAYNLTQTGANNPELNLVLPLLEIEPILTKSIQTWQEWSNAGLAVYAPSLFPIISKSADIAQIVAGSNLQQVIGAIDGNRTLRSLAPNYRQSLLNFTTALLPLLRSGFITLSPRPKSRVARLVQPDISDSLIERSTGSLSTGTYGTSSYSSANHSTHSFGTGSQSMSTNTLTNSPTIACIDDSILIYQSLERILTEHGYRCFGIQDPLKIMPGLIRNKPNFIFLDLLMPIVNGYEVCEQIRKTPSLKDVPVIILTGKDGLIDRMRSKMVGATGFLGKPVDEDAVLKMLDKYLVGVKKP